MDKLSKRINNIPVYLYNTNKFKSINIRLVFKNYFNKENATKYSLLTSILSNTCKKYNTKRKVSNVLDDLYSANIVISTYPIHKTRLTTFNLTIINQKYINENLINKGIELLKEFILNPNLEDGIFNQKVFEEEKSLLEEDLKLIYNNKNKYAYRQMIKHMCKDEIASVNSNGSLDDLENITSIDIYDTYLDMINESVKEVFIIGDLEFEDFDKKLEKELLSKLTQKQLNLDYCLIENKEVIDIKNIIETADTNQAQLMIGYRTTVGILDEDYHALRLFVSMFGGTYSSSLNQVIREEHSFAYSIFASIIKRAKIVYINAGLDAKNCDETINLIATELNKYQNGEIDENLLNLVKAEHLDSLNSFEDSPGTILDTFITLNLIYGNIREFNTTSEYCDMIRNCVEKITVEDIKKVANTLTLDTIYRLQKEKI